MDHLFVINVEGAVYKGNHWLFIRRSMSEEHAGGEISLVGGTVDHEGFSSDILERTLRRELFEEVGIEVKETMQYVRNTSFVTASGTQVVDIVFLCEIEKGEPYPKSPDEVDEILWLTTEEILSREETPDFLRENIKAAERLKRKEFV